MQIVNQKVSCLVYQCRTMHTAAIGHAVVASVCHYSRSFAFLHKSLNGCNQRSWLELVSNYDECHAGARARGLMARWQATSTPLQHMFKRRATGTAEHVRPATKVNDFPTTCRPAEPRARNARGRQTVVTRRRVGISPRGIRGSEGQRGCSGVAVTPRTAEDRLSQCDGELSWTDWLARCRASFV